MEDIIQVEKKATKRSGRARRSVAVILSGAMLGLGALAPAAFAASTAGTDATFSLTGGDIAITAPAGATLTDGLAGAASVTGSLGAIEVTDARGGVVGWVTSRSSTVFTGPGADIPTSAVMYTPGSLTSSSGDFTPTVGSASVMTAPATAFSGTLVTGNNTATLTPSITVTLPSNAQVGDFIGTITHSVI